MATALITGSAGFIGSHLADRLLGLGYKVIGIDNLLLGKLSNLAKARSNPNFHFIQEDLNQEEACFNKVSQLAGQVDVVWHLAANSDILAGVSDPSVDLRNTLLTTYSTLSLARRLKIPHFLFASSSAIYGDLSVRLKEDTGPLFPISNYGAMKLGSEGLISAALESFLERAFIFRFPNVIGGRATHGVTYDFLRKLKADPTMLEVLGDGEQQKPYLHVSELIDAMLTVYEKSKERMNCFNIGQVDTSTKVRFIAEQVIRVAAPGAKIRYTGGKKGWVGDVPKFEFSIDKIRALGWQPKETSDHSVLRAIQEIHGELSDSR